jgi:histidinol-phosphate/aromatic aminotransferase/cobyric acid decarboxylase-like protein
MEANVAGIVAERAVLAGRLAGLGLAARPSATNFLLAPVGEQAHRVAGDLMDRFGLVVRTFPTGHSLAGHLRFTIRDPESHDRLIDALERVL